MTDLFSYAESAKARDIGVRQVSLNHPCFMSDALAYLKTRGVLNRYEEFTGEDIREWLVSAHVIQPQHANAWGALILTAVRRKIIVGTDRYVPMKLKTSRARKNQVYRWTSL